MSLAEGLDQEEGQDATDNLINSLRQSLTTLEEVVNKSRGIGYELLTKTRKRLNSYLEEIENDSDLQQKILEYFKNPQQQVKFYPSLPVPSNNNGQEKQLVEDYTLVYEIFCILINYFAHNLEDIRDSIFTLRDREEYIRYIKFKRNEIERIKNHLNYLGEEDIRQEMTRIANELIFNHQTQKVKDLHRLDFDFQLNENHILYLKLFISFSSLVAEIIQETSKGPAPDLIQNIINTTISLRLSISIPQES